MKIEMTKGLKFSTNGIKVVSLDKGAILEVGVNGLTETNLARLIELEVAEVLGVSDVATEEVAAEVIDFTKITDKDELDLFAQEKYAIELDRRKSLKKMIAELEDAIANKGE